MSLAWAWFAFRCDLGLDVRLPESYYKPELLRNQTGLMMMSLTMSWTIKNQRVLSPSLRFDCSILPRMLRREICFDDCIDCTGGRNTVRQLAARLGRDRRKIDFRMSHRDKDRRNGESS